MTTYHIWDNFVGAPGTGTSGQNEEIGNAFSVSVSAGVTGLRWRAGNTNPADKPIALNLWDGNTGAQLAHITSIGHTGLAGWQEELLFPAVPLVPGQRYVGSASYPSGKTYTTTASDAAPTPPLAFASTKHITDSAHAYAYPNATSGANAWWVDVTVDDSKGGAAGTGGGLDYQGAVNADNAANNAWLNVGGGDFPTISIPVIDHGILTDASHGLAAIKADLHGAVAPGTLIGDEIEATKVLAQGAKDAVTNTPFGGTSLPGFLAAMTPAIVTATGVFFHGSDALVDPGGGTEGGTAFHGPGGLQVAQGVEQLIALPNAVGTFPGAGWGMTDETDWMDAIVYAQPADLYVLDVYTFDANLDTTTVAGVDLYYRLGWWAPLNGSYLGSRRYVEFLGSHLEVGGQRMNGCLIALPKGGTGHVQAWTYTP